MRSSRATSCVCVLVGALLCLVVPSSATPASNEQMSRDGANNGQSEPRRNDKALPYYHLIPPQYYGYGQESNNEVLARTEPLLHGKPVAYPDSPIYYIRMPPTPYVFVPGLGYVSQPPPPPQYSPFINLPIDFVANGKPTNVYQWPRPPAPPAPPSTPRPDSPVSTLDKGPYVFNGRPSDLYILRNSYNALYSDSLQSFYP